LLKCGEDKPDLDPLLPGRRPKWWTSSSASRAWAKSTKNGNDRKNGKRSIHLKQLWCCFAWTQHLTKNCRLQRLKWILKLN